MTRRLTGPRTSVTGTTVTVTANGGGNQNQAPPLQVVQITGNIHGFGVAPQQVVPVQHFNGPGQMLGPGNQGVPPPNSMAALAREREERERERRRQRQLQQQQLQIPQPPEPPQPPQTQVIHAGPDEAQARELQTIAAQRMLLLAAMFAVFQRWQKSTLLGLCTLLNRIDEIQSHIDALENRARTLHHRMAQGPRVAGGGGPPPNPPPGGGLTPVADDVPHLVLRLRPSLVRFRAARSVLEAFQNKLLQGQQAKSAQRERFERARAQLQAQQQILLQGQQARSAQRQRFEAAQNAIGAQLLPAPGAVWQSMTQQHANFLNAVAALTNHPPPIVPTANWQQIVQQHANFQAALVHLTAHPPPVVPTVGWHNLVQSALNFQQALAAFALHPPLPLQQIPIVNNNNHAPAPYHILGPRIIHILHGDHTGGQHLGMHNPALHGAPPNAVTVHNVPGHHITYFPVAWTAQDVLDALIEAAAATYHLAVQQYNGNWLHPAVQVSRRGITIWIVVVTRANGYGLTVHTAWPL